MKYNKPHEVVVGVDTNITATGRLNFFVTVQYKLGDYGRENTVQLNIILVKNGPKYNEAPPYPPKLPPFASD